MSNFYVGQEVVCVDDALHAEWQKRRHNGDMGGLTAGRHYFIREIGVCDANGLGIKVREIMRTPVDAFYMARRFAPIKESNIQIFRDMCINVKRNIDA